MLFKHPPTRPSNSVDYPAGVFVNTEKGYFYIAGPGRRFRCISKRVLDSWSPPRVVLSSEAACSSFKVVAKLKFRNGSLLQSVGDGKLYFISDGKRRHIQSPDWYERVGTSVRECYDTCIRVSTDEINLHEEGAPLH
jgi:hypothetical protein